MSAPANQNKPVIVPDKLGIIVAGSLLALSACAWIAIYYLMPLTMQTQSGIMSFGIAAMVSSPLLASISLFEVVWIVGMTAMMLPAMSPIVIFYNRLVTRQESNPSLARAAGTPLFLGGYLLVYAILGAAAYLCVFEVIAISASFSNLVFLSFFASGLVLIGTGIYQLSSLKSRCLKQCVSPMSFFAIHYKTGLLGSLRMGLTHGYYCAGCCWAFMIVMLVDGSMSIPIMALLAGVISLEKILSRGATFFNRLVALGFILFGVALIAFPGILFHI